jgi:hypothetical protein
MSDIMVLVSLGIVNVGVHVSGSYLSVLARSRVSSLGGKAQYQKSR